MITLTFGGALGQVNFAILLALANVAAETKTLVRNDERHVDLARNPVVDLEASSADDEDVGVGLEAGGSATKTDQLPAAGRHERHSLGRGNVLVTSRAFVINLSG